MCSNCKLSTIEIINNTYDEEIWEINKLQCSNIPIQIINKIIEYIYHINGHYVYAESKKRVADENGDEDYHYGIYANKFCTLCFQSGIYNKLNDIYDSRLPYLRMHISWFYRNNFMDIKNIMKEYFIHINLPKNYSIEYYRKKFPIQSDIDKNNKWDTITTR